VNVLPPRLDCLPAAQQVLWPQLGEVGDEFVLYGGTALALQLGGRLSVDFDFFSPQPFEPEKLAAKYSFLKGAPLLQRAAATATFSVPVGSDDVKISFFGTLEFGRVGTPVRFADNRICAAALLDLAAQKVKVVQVRAEAKDYLDVCALLREGIHLEEALGAAAALYPGFNPAVSLKALGYFADVPQVPWDVRRDLTSAAIRVGKIPEIPKQSSSLLP
jgi:hypothetical protein